MADLDDGIIVAISRVVLSQHLRLNYSRLDATVDPSHLAVLKSSYRIALIAASVKIDGIKPIAFVGTKGARFTYHFSNS